MTLEEYISPRLLSELDRISTHIKAAYLINGEGRRKSSQKGNSMDFSGFRAYTQGDCIRNIDWRGYARSEKTNVKLFTDERQSIINIFIDISKSMDYGEGSENKLFFSALLALFICYCHLRNNDCVNLYSLGNETSVIFSSATSLNSFPLIVKAMDRAIAVPSESCSELNFNKIKGSGISFVISDFYSRELLENTVNSLNRGLSHTILIQPLTRNEAEPNFSGEMAFTDAESGQECSLNITAAAIEEYKSLFNEYKKQIKAFSLSKGVAFWDCFTDINISDLIYKILMGSDYL